VLEYCLLDCLSPLGDRLAMGNGGGWCRVVWVSVSVGVGAYYLFDS
jgi:hypothetical protein